MLGRACRQGLVLALIALAGMAATAQAGGHRRSATNVQALETHLLWRLNSLRRSRGLPPLRLSKALSAAAESHALDMLERGYFAHDSLDGTPFRLRLLRFYPPRRPLWAVGENLLWSARGLAAQGALRRWLASPQHRANLLDLRWREVGIAAIRADGAPGVYGGQAVIVLTVDFGVR